MHDPRREEEHQRHRQVRLEAPLASPEAHIGAVRDDQPRHLPETLRGGPGRRLARRGYATNMGEAGIA